MVRLTSTRSGAVESAERPSDEMLNGELLVVSQARTHAVTTVAMTGIARIRTTIDSASAGQTASAITTTTIANVVDLLTDQDPLGALHTSDTVPTRKRSLPQVQSQVLMVQHQEDIPL